MTDKILEYLARGLMYLITALAVLFGGVAVAFGVVGIWLLFAADRIEEEL